MVGVIVSFAAAKPSAGPREYQEVLLADACPPRLTTRVPFGSETVGPGPSLGCYYRTRDEGSMLRLGIIGRRYDNAIGTIIRGLYRLSRNAITDANTDPVVGFSPYSSLSHSISPRD